MNTSRENLLKVLRHEKPDRIPVTVHMDRYNQPSREGMDPDLNAAIGKVDFGDGSELYMAKALGVDVMDHVSPPVRKVYSKVSVEKIDFDGGWTTIYKTPYGDLQETCKIVREDGTFFRTERFVKGPEDLKALRCVFENEEYELKDGAYDHIKSQKTAVGDRGILRAYMPGTPLGMMVRQYMELDTLAYIWADEHDEFIQLLEIVGEKYIQQFSLAASLGYDALYCTDDTSTTTISPAMFEECCLEFTNSAADAVHKHGTFYVHHSCGYIGKLLHLYRQTRMDAVDAVGPRENDTPSFEFIRDKLGPNIAMIGGITWSEDERFADTPENRINVGESIRDTFESVAPGHNIILPIYPLQFHTMDMLSFVAAECRKHSGMYSKN